MGRKDVTAQAGMAAEFAAMDEFETVRGRLIVVQDVEGYRGSDSVSVRLEPPAVFRVLPTPRGDIARWCDEWCDPCWNVEPVERRPELEGLTSMWVYGTSINGRTADVDRARHRRAGWRDLARVVRSWARAA